MRAAPPALLAVLRQLVGRAAGRNDDPLASLAGRAELPTRNTRGVVTGVLRAAGQLRFHD